MYKLLYCIYNFIFNEQMICRIKFNRKLTPMKTLPLGGTLLPSLLSDTSAWMCQKDLLLSGKTQKVSCFLIWAWSSERATGRRWPGWGSRSNHCWKRKQWVLLSEAGIRKTSSLKRSLFHLNRENKNFNKNTLDSLKINDQITSDKT